MSVARRLLTNASKGELSPLIEGRPDLAAYFEGGSEILNFNLMRQGGLDRRVGSRFVARAKHADKDAILLPFESSVLDAYPLEMGDAYFRIFKDKAPIGAPLEIVSPYTEAQLRTIHYTQSVDIMFTFQGEVAQQKISRVSDVSWFISTIVFNPPPSFEADTDISGGTITLTPAATTGTDVIFTASAAVFLEADVGRIIVFGASRARITLFGSSAGDVTSPNDQVRATILDAFPNTSPIPAGSWFLNLSPQTTIDVDHATPVNGPVIFTTGSPALRAADVGKYINLYGGSIRIDTVDSPSQGTGTILSVLSGANNDPAATEAWTLEVQSWSVANGFPKTGEFFQGRLGQGFTVAEKTTFWLSATDSFDNYATGILASSAITYTIAARQLNIGEWMADNVDLFIGTAGSEIKISGTKEAEPLGGDQVPFATKFETIGSTSVQPVVTGRKIIFLDRSRKRVYTIGFDIQEDGFGIVEITGAAEHIMGSAGARLGPIAFAKRPDPRLYFIREDGQLVTLTYNYREKVIGFTRYVTDGTFEAVTVIPQPGTLPDQVWVIVKRTIDNNIVRYVEVLDTEASELTGREWTSLQTDCAKVYDLAGTPTTILTGLSHLEGKLVDVITDGSYRGQLTVSGGQITLAEVASEHAEVGLNYVSRYTTMRPAVEGQMVEGIVRRWQEIWVRVKDTIGGLIQGTRIPYTPSSLNTNVLKTGDFFVNPQENWSYDGKITIEQRQPYPMKLLAIFGEVKFGDR